MKVNARQTPACCSQVGSLPVRLLRCKPSPTELLFEQRAAMNTTIKYFSVLRNTFPVSQTILKGINRGFQEHECVFSVYHFGVGGLGAGGG